MLWFPMAFCHANSFRGSVLVRAGNYQIAECAEEPVLEICGAGEKC